MTSINPTDCRPSLGKPSIAGAEPGGGGNADPKQHQAQIDKQRWQADYVILSHETGVQRHASGVVVLDQRSHQHILLAADIADNLQTRMRQIRHEGTRCCVIAKT